MIVEIAVSKYLDKRFDSQRQASLGISTAGQSNQDATKRDQGVLEHQEGPKAVIFLPRERNKYNFEVLDEARSVQWHGPDVIPFTKLELADDVQQPQKQCDLEACT